MKIGLVCPYNLFRPGGVQGVIFAISHELVRHGHDVKIIAPRPRQVPKKHDKNILLLGRAYPVKALRTSSEVSFEVNTSQLDQLLDAERFDLLHIHEPWTPHLNMQVLERATCPTIGTFHAALPESAFKKPLEQLIAPYARRALKRLTRLTAVSDAAAEYARSLAGKHEVRIIPNGIDLQFYDRKKAASLQASKHKTILYVGRLEERKGVLCLLKAYRLLQSTHPNIRLQIAGDGHLRGQLEAYAREHDLSVKFLGYVSDEEKRDLLGEADLFCSPALYGESFGIVLLEAMAMGTVTVCGNNAGYSSVMKDKGSISLVDPLKTDLLADRLSLLLFDEDMRAMWRTWAKRYVRQFDWPQVVDAYEDVYAGLIKK